MSEIQQTERNSFYVKGNPKEVASKLARLIDCSNPDNTGTGVEKQFDMTSIEQNKLEALGLNVGDIGDSYTVNLLHRNRLMSEIVMGFFGQQAGMRALVIGYKSKPNQSEVIPYYLGGPISPDNMDKAGLELIRE